MNKIIKCFIFLLFFLYGELIASEFHAITVASHETDGLKRLIHSAEVYGLEIEVLGLGLPYKGNSQKLTYMKHYIRELPDNDVILFVDGFDVFFLAGQEKILSKFYEMEVECLFAAELSIYPYKRGVYQRYPKSPTRFRFLNSGTIIAYVGALRTLLEGLGEYDEKKSDQGYFHPYFVKNPKILQLDYYCELFLSLWKLKKDKYEINRQKRRLNLYETGSSPMIIHGPGPSKGTHKRLFSMLFLPEYQ